MTIGFSQDVFEGHVDRVENGRVFGWLWQSDLPNAPVSVDLYVDNVYEQTTVALLYRADLESAGKGNGRHAFEVTLPARCYDGKAHGIKLCCQGTTLELHGSPQSVSLEPRTTPAFRIDNQQRVTAVPNPSKTSVLPRFRMFGVLGTWMEADVVAANIRNAMTQGCERVYLVDNGSTDGTVDIACAEGAILARLFRTDRYDENLRLRHMNDVVSEVSESERDQYIWWLFLDADEFAHGPGGMTLRDYLKTLDKKFRVVGTRFFDHYPGDSPHYVPGRHPLDFQPLCEELAYPMCPSMHRKHPLQRYDRGGAPIECGRGFHLAQCTDQLYEPSQPAFLHHFPFREENVTRGRLKALWAKDQKGVARALESHDTHMLTRFRSLDAVYSQDWARVGNFITVDPMCGLLESPPPASGVSLRPWTEMVATEHQHVLRWYSVIGVWNYDKLDKFNYGDDTTYKKGIAFLDGHGTIEDWGCGFAHAKPFVTKSQYVGIDGSSKHADKIVDLREYTSETDCIFMRHVLEHNFDWRRILANAIASFKKRMVLVIFTPLSETTRQIATSTVLTSIPVPDISFRKEDLTDYFKHYRCTEESLKTDTQYGTEHVFYIEKYAEEQLPTQTSRVTRLEEQLGSELDAWAAAGMTARLWWRDDDAASDTPQLRRLLDVARDVGIVVALAVVPERADDSLATLVSPAECCIWQHGWGHHFHASGEFGDGRALDLMMDDALAGQRSLDRLFGPAGWQRVFVPPNHALSVPFKALIPSLGYLGVSAGVQLTPPIDHVIEMNADTDVMNWSEGKILGADGICRMLVDQLMARRTGEAPCKRPIGILTHHLAFDDDAWDFVSRLLRYLKSHPAVEVLRADTLFEVPSDSLMQAPPADLPGRVKHPDQSTASITVVITSCGRQDLLVRTLDSFLKYNGYPIREVVVIEDGEAEKNVALQERYRQHDFRWLSTGAQVGQIAAIDMVYRSVETEYIFHCEDDWEFFAPGFMEKSLSVLTHNPDILQVWVRALSDTNNSPVMDYVFFADEVPYRLIQPGHHTEEWGTWYGFSFNPGLRRRRDYQLLGSFGTLDPLRQKRSYEVEREASEFYLKHGFLAAILADNDGKGYVKHIGWGRRVSTPSHEHPA